MFGFRSSRSSRGPASLRNDNSYFNRRLAWREAEITVLNNLRCGLHPDFLEERFMNDMRTAVDNYRPIVLQSCSCILSNLRLAGMFSGLPTLNEYYAIHSMELERAQFEIMMRNRFMNSTRFYTCATDEKTERELANSRGLQKEEQERLQLLKEQEHQKVEEQYKANEEALRRQIADCNTRVKQLQTRLNIQERRSNGESSRNAESERGRQRSRSNAKFRDTTPSRIRNYIINTRTPSPTDRSRKPERRASQSRKRDSQPSHSAASNSVHERRPPVSNNHFFQNLSLVDGITTLRIRSKSRDGRSSRDYSRGRGQSRDREASMSDFTSSRCDDSIYSDSTIRTPSKTGGHRVETVHKDPKEGVPFDGGYAYTLSTDSTIDEREHRRHLQQSAEPHMRSNRRPGYPDLRSRYGA